MASMTQIAHTCMFTDAAGKIIYGRQAGGHSDNEVPSDQERKHGHLAAAPEGDSRSAPETDPGSLNAEAGRGSPSGSETDGATPNGSEINRGSPSGLETPNGSEIDRGSPSGFEVPKGLETDRGRPSGFESPIDSETDRASPSVSDSETETASSDSETDTAPSDSETDTASPSGSVQADRWSSSDSETDTASPSDDKVEGGEGGEDADLPPHNGSFENEVLSGVVFEDDGNSSLSDDSLAWDLEDIGPEGYAALGDDAQPVHISQKYAEDLDEEERVPPGPEQRCPLPSLDWADAADPWVGFKDKDTSYECYVLLDCDLHPGLTPQMRSNTFRNFSRFCEEWRLQKEVTYKAMDYLDRYLASTHDIEDAEDLLHVAAAALFVAVKIEVNGGVKIRHVATSALGFCPEAAVREVEPILCETLKWCLQPVTAHAWLLLYLQVEGQERQGVHGLNEVQYAAPCPAFQEPKFDPELYHRAVELLDISMREVEALKFGYCVLAAAVLKIVGDRQDPRLNFNTGLNSDDVTVCVRWMETVIS